MALDDDVRKCCEEIEGVRSEAEKLKCHCADEVKRDLAALEEKLDRFLNQAKDATTKPETGVLPRLEALISNWRTAAGRCRMQLQLLEAKSNLASAKRLADDQYFLAAESALTTALEQVVQARTLAVADDPQLTELVQQIEHAVSDIHAKADTAAATLEEVVGHNQRLIADLELPA